MTLNRLDGLTTEQLADITGLPHWVVTTESTAIIDLHGASGNSDGFKVELTVVYPDPDHPETPANAMIYPFRWTDHPELVGEDGPRDNLPALGHVKDAIDRYLADHNNPIPVTAILHAPREHTRVTIDTAALLALALANHPAPPEVGQVNPAQVSMAHEYPRGLVVIGHVQTNPDKQPAVALPETIHIPLEQRLRLREAERQGAQILRHATAANTRDMFVTRLHDHGYTVVDDPHLIPATPPWVHVEYQEDRYNVAAPAVSYATTIESPGYRFQVTMTWPDPNQWDSCQYHGKPGPTW